MKKSLALTSLLGRLLIDKHACSRVKLALSFGFSPVVKMTSASCRACY